jgi:hypothetical protein
MGERDTGVQGLWRPWAAGRMEWLRERSTAGELQASEEPVDPPSPSVSLSG